MTGIGFNIIFRLGKKVGINLSKKIDRRDRDIADKILLYSNKNLVEGKAIYRGRLRASGKVQKISESELSIEKMIFGKSYKKNTYRVGYTIPYATIIEYGWKPLNPDWYPPFENIKMWVRRKLKKKVDLDKTTWKVIMKMKRVGFPNPRLGVSPRNYFYRAIKRVKAEYKIKNPIAIRGRYGQIVRFA